MSVRWKCDWCGAETFPDDRNWSELTFEGKTHHYCKMCKNVVRTHILHPEDERKNLIATVMGVDKDE